MAKEIDTIFVTIGWKNSSIPMAEKIAVFVDKKTPIQIAKILRKEFAENPFHHGYSIDTKPFKPSDLFYAIYEYSDSTFPFAHSLNTPEKFLNIKKIK